MAPGREEKVAVPAEVWGAARRASQALLADKAGGLGAVAGTAVGAV